MEFHTSFLVLFPESGGRQGDLLGLLARRVRLVGETAGE
jgi:hypothetical protein